uniref:G_PROTEIN_RECEP_F1_2 domain-containing protein n=1 Tax=Panagrellus redivivus TaxID=6233 RepID=A0A7E4VL34_PANRE
MLTYNPFYEGTLLFLAILSVVLNNYAFYLIMFKMPSSMRDFRHCLYMLCILDGLFAFVLGVVLNTKIAFSTSNSRSSPPDEP